jgi:hypothetical protein
MISQQIRLTRPTNAADKLLKVVIPFTLGCLFTGFSLISMQRADNYWEVKKCDAIKTSKIITQRSAVGTLKSCVSVGQLYLQ